MSSIIEVVLEVLADGECHSKKDIESVLIDKGIIDTRNSVLVRNTLYEMRRKSIIHTVERGIYKKGKFELNEPYLISTEELDTVVSKIIKDLNFLKSINIMNCSEDMYKRCRLRVAKLRTLQKEIADVIGE